MNILGPKQIQATDPFSLVEAALKQAKQFKKDFGFEYTEIWCVFDRDQHTIFSDAQILAKKHKVKIAYSIPCFELWVILHYQEQNAEIDPRKLISSLKHKCGLDDYDKNGSALFKVLEENREIATIRAKALRRRHEKDDRPPWTNPSTNMDELMERLYKLFEKN
ncbi:RloB family protein [Dethiosulfatarculus sandiegensis]|uniref:RloB-like protein n=1 Tax=Dethiosulfatarculus sandiegensis TaxID=1429043 RepID=A0A0D2JA70_9BACT|nr:RloB family protein [Dethiosulfatarculus sandiegensis]KIX12621.1 hypothetical protein X474_18625 [Dethiosulfatarculus sandiegensis]